MFDGKVVDIADGEWLEYTAELGSGLHRIGVNVASTVAGGEIVVLAATTNSAGYLREIGSIDVPNTNGAVSTQWLEEAVDLAFVEGVDSVFRLEFREGGDFAVDSFEFETPIAPDQFAFNDEQRTISFSDGLTIKLPEYDTGGEGVAYSDTTATNDTNSGFRSNEGVDTTEGLYYK